MGKSTVADMKDDTSRFESIEPDHPISVIAAALAEQAPQVAGMYRITLMDVAVAYCNAAAQILASSKDMPREAALGRIRDLHKVMEATYEMQEVNTSARN